MYRLLLDRSANSMVKCATFQYSGSYLLTDQLPAHESCDSAIEMQAGGEVEPYFAEQYIAKERRKGGQECNSGFAIAS